MKNLKLIAIDLDKTFLRYDKTFDVDRFMSVFKELSSKEIQFVFITGHQREDAKRYLGDFVNKYIYIASHNGNYLELQEKCIQKILIPPNIVWKALSQLEKFGSLPLVLDSGDKSWITTCSDIGSQAFNYLYASRINCQGLLKIAFNISERLDEFENELNKLQRYSEKLDVICRQNQWIELHYKSDGKGGIIEYIQNTHNICYEESMCIGNHKNDVSMTKFCKYSVCMENSHEDLKKAAQYEIGSNEDQSVINFLEEINHANHVKIISKYLFS